MSDTSQPTFANRTPLRIGDVGLAVRDLKSVAAYYVDLLGLETIEDGGGTVSLGAGGVPLVRLVERTDALPDDSSQAGLFHTAFLMPRRADLAHWTMRASRDARPIDGASDHLVSEAFYLRDPEGNGIEIYADRPREDWPRENGALKMATEPLDIAALIRAADAPDAEYDAAPAGLRIGHVHLRVGDTATVERFYVGALGLDVTTRYPGATFLSSGGYHHHIAGNVWASRGAEARDPQRAGLAWLTLEARDEPTLAETVDRLGAAGIAIDEVDGAPVVSDPWGTQIRLSAA